MWPCVGKIGSAGSALVSTKAPASTNANGGRNTGLGSLYLPPAAFYNRKRYRQEAIVRCSSTSHGTFAQPVSAVLSLLFRFAHLSVTAIDRALPRYQYKHWEPRNRRLVATILRKYLSDRVHISSAHFSIPLPGPTDWEHWSDEYR